MRAGFIVFTLATIMAFPIASGADQTGVAAIGGKLYLGVGAGPARFGSSGFSYGRLSGTSNNPGFVFNNDVEGFSNVITLGFLVNDGASSRSWLGKRTRVELRMADGGGRTYAESQSPIGARIPLVNGQPPNLQLTTVNNNNYVLQQDHRNYDLVLASDYDTGITNVIVSPFIGISQYHRTERYELTSIDPGPAAPDFILSETLDTDYQGFTIGASVSKELFAKWFILLSGSYSRLNAESDLSAQQLIVSFPPGVGTPASATDSAKNSANRKTGMIGLTRDFGDVIVALSAQRDSWSYVSVAVNPVLFTDPPAHLGSTDAEDWHYHLSVTVLLGR